MAIREIPDETALPFDRKASRAAFEWIRNKIDPTVLIDCLTGDCFRRRDGAKWEYPAYRVQKNVAGEWQPIAAANAWYDSAIYTPASKRSAA